MIEPLLTGLVLAWCLTVAILIVVFRRAIFAAWREPVLGVPVLILESDDWGPGPDYQSGAMADLMRTLCSVRDRKGHPACMTLGLILSAPDGDFIRANGCREYRGRWLDDVKYAPLLRAIRDGIEAGCFAPQLHGSAHYWPPALLAAARVDAAVREWVQGGEHETEQLPGHLQSRWTDASVLPSRPLDEAAQRHAVTEEMAAYQRIIGHHPCVVVPPTFLWNEAVERAWAEEGACCVITPGCRFTRRDSEGHPSEVDRHYYNGDTGSAGLLHIVRDIYFEPSLGHRAEKVLEEMNENTRLGRPCLLEMHRFNFTDAQRNPSLAELLRLLQMALERFTDLRFLSSEQLAREYSHHGGCLEGHAARRLAVRLERMLRIPRFGRLARLTGLALPLRWMARGCA